MRSDTLRARSSSMHVVIGRRRTEVLVIASRTVAYRQSVRVGGHDMDTGIALEMQRRHGLIIDAETAERVKITIGSAQPLGELLTMEVSGRDLGGGTSKSVVVDSDEIREGMRETTKAIVEAVLIAIQRTPPEVGLGMLRNGITLAGGGSLVRGLDALLRRETGLPVVIGEAPAIEPPG